VDFISLSLGGEHFHQGVYEQCLRAAQENIVVICAAGNSGSLHRFNVDFPANVASNIRVGSIDNDGQGSAFSSIGGGEIDIVSFGENVFSTWPNNSYDLATGTSMATPCVTALCALLVAYIRVLRIPFKMSEFTIRSLFKRLCFNSANEVKKGRGFFEVKEILNVPELLKFIINDM